MKRIYYFLKYLWQPWDEGQIGIKSAWIVAGIIAECKSVSPYPASLRVGKDSAAM